MQCWNCHFSLCWRCRMWRWECLTSSTSAGDICLSCVPAWSVHTTDSHLLPEEAVTQGWEWQESCGSLREEGGTIEGVAGALTWPRKEMVNDNWGNKSHGDYSGWSKQQKRRPSWQFQKHASVVLHSSEVDIRAGWRDYACSSLLVIILVQKDSWPGTTEQWYLSFVPFLSAVVMLEVSSHLLQSHNCLLKNA